MEKRGESRFRKRTEHEVRMSVGRNKPTLTAADAVSVESILDELESSLGYPEAGAGKSGEEEVAVLDEMSTEAPDPMKGQKSDSTSGPWDGASLLDYEYVLRHHGDSASATARGPGEVEPDRSPVTLEPWPPEIEEGAGRIAAALIAERKRTGRKVYLFAGPSGGEGVTTLAQASAEKLAKGGHRVLLLDADVRKTNAGRRYGVENDRGLVDLLHGRCRLDEAIRSVPLKNLSYLPPGVLRLGEEISDRGIGELCRELSDHFDFVLIDCPPVLKSPVVAAFAASGAQAILFARAHRTRRPVLEKAAEELARLAVPVAAIALNERDFPLPNWLYRLL